MRPTPSILLASLARWLPLAVLTVLLTGLIYTIGQQVERGSANDPQIQMVTDARDALAAGASPQSLVPTTQIDIARSYAPYLVIYDANAQVVAASATLHGQPIVPPAGVFQSARAAPPDTITWMPEAGVRSAIAVVAYPGGYVLAGRSLTLVEEREDALLHIALAGGAATLILTYVAVLAVLAATAATHWLAATPVPVR
jgi:hypothetical protein